jgi:uncharacterized membrane protein
MDSKVKILGHPLHPMLIPYPIAFYTTTLVSYIVYGFSGDPFWFRAAYAANIAGVLTALLAAAVGSIDLLTAVPNGTDARRHGYQHMALNSTALVLFALNIWFNAGQWDAVAPVMRFAIVLPLIGFLLTLGAGYLGWTLVQTHHVGIQLSEAEERMEERRRRAA